MGLELIAAVIAAAPLGLMVWALRRKWTGLPKWSVPAAAALGLIGFTVWSEYDWFSRVSAELPEGVKVVWTADSSSPLRPWTYLFPMVTQFVAMDQRETLVHPADADVRLSRVFNFRRWHGVQEAMMAVDCETGGRVLLTEAIRIDDTGTLSGGEWLPVGPEDGIVKAACQGA